MNQRKNQKNKNPIIGGRKFKDKNIMTETKLQQLIFILVATIIILFTTLAIVITTHRTRKQPETKTIVITDTITNVIYDTLFIDHFVTKKLQLTDTLYIDSVKIDSVFVEVPISVYKLDTTFTTDTTNLNIHIQNSGFNVTLDTLSYKFTYQPTPPVIKKKRHRFGFFVGPTVGVGYDYLNNKPVPTVGIGVGIGFSFGKY